jgi:hypothetical protein
MPKIGSKDLYLITETEKKKNISKMHSVSSKSSSAINGKDNNFPSDKKCNNMKDIN